MLLLPYHLRLALRSLRRDPGLSATIVLVLAIAAGIFCTALMHYLRNHQTTSSAPASLHQVEIAVAREALAAAFVPMKAFSSASCDRTISTWCSDAGSAAEASTYVRR